MSGDGANRPLGLLASHTWVEDEGEFHPKKKSGAKKTQKSWGRVGADRWIRSITEAGDRVGESVRCVHVIDAEAGGFKLFSTVIERGEEFVVRFRKHHNVAFEETPEQFVPIAQPGASRHLAVLRDAGLVDVRQEGRQRVYSLRPTAFSEVTDWLEHRRVVWERRFGALHTEVARGKRQRRETT